MNKIPSIIAAILVTSAVMLSGCDSKEQQASENTQLSQESQTPQYQYYDIYEDTNYDVPEGYTDVIEGRQYGSMSRYSIIQHLQINTRG